ncbi:putative pectin methyltransferase QUA2 [Capsicum chinense]|nr:putative pectin methyltransferase QUA2 [Capsicum chinense]
MIDLSESKRPDEINNINDPKYCKYHRVVGHPTGKFFILKEKIMMLVSEGKIIIDVDEIVEANHSSIIPKKKECSMLQTMTSSIFLQFRSFDPVEVDFPRKTLKGSLGTDNKAKDNDDWTLVSHKKMRKMIDGALSRKDRRPITLYEIFSEKFLEDSSKLHNRPLFVVGAIREQHPIHILIDDGSEINIMPKTVLKRLEISIDKLSKSNITIQDAKFYLDSCELGMEKPIISNPNNVVPKKVEVQRAAVKMPKERIEKFSAKLSSSEGDMHTKWMKNILFFATSLVPSITPELPGSNTLAHKIEEYQALIVGIEMELDMKIPQLDIYGDSKLIINQLSGSYEVKKEDLFPYHQYTILMLERFDQVFLNHVPREQNLLADALDNLATILPLEENESTKVQVAGPFVGGGGVSILRESKEPPELSVTCELLQSDRLFLIEIDHLLKPGGYFVLSSPTIQQQHSRTISAKKGSSPLEEVTKKLCWSLLAQPDDDDPLPQYNMMHNVMDMNAHYSGLSTVLMKEGKSRWVIFSDTLGPIEKARVLAAQIRWESKVIDLQNGSDQRLLDKFYNQATFNLSKASVVDKVANITCNAIGNSNYAAIKAGFTNPKIDQETRTSFKGEIPVCKGNDIQMYYQPLVSCISGITSQGIQPNDSFKDSDFWKLALRNYWSLLSPLIFSDHLKRQGDDDPLPPYNMVHNVMDINAHYGGLSAALMKKEKLVWVMNVVPLGMHNTLPFIYNRGFSSVLHNWCEPFPTYPRAYDLLHSNGLLSYITSQRCSMFELLLEINRILRPEAIFC